MQSSFQITFVFAAALAIAQGAHAQKNSDNLILTQDTMEANTLTNKEIIQHLYENILNKRKLELAADIVSPDYISPSGEKGAGAFTKGVIAVVNGLPDARWTLEKIVADGNTVIVKQMLSGTHKGYFQGMAPTNRLVSNSGFVVYVFEKGKIVSHDVQTDRLSFLQQLGVLPDEIKGPQQDSQNHVFFIDKFSVPEGAITTFLERMSYNRSFIKTIPGFVKDEVFVQEIAGGDRMVMTIAEWESQQHLDEAKKLVQAEYQRINFNPAEFTEALGIKMERGLYSNFQR